MGHYRITAAFAASALAIGAAFAVPGMAAGTNMAQPSKSAVSPETGVHIIGRKDARLKLTEYVSYTCPHCGEFHEEAGDTLKLVYVSQGGVAVETRHIVRDPADLAVALTANCGDENRFAGNHNILFRNQSKWLGKLQQTTPAQRARYVSGTVPSRMQALAGDMGLYELMKRRGYTKTQLDRCLADETMARALSAKSAEYLANGVRSTPSFAIDGVLLAGTHDWKTLKPQLDARLKP